MRILSPRPTFFFVFVLYVSLHRTLGMCQGANEPHTVNGTDNGIAVGRPKIFDNRSLQIMLDSLNASLQNAQFFNPTTISAAVGTLQGTESHDVTRNFTLSASFPPQTPAANSGSGNSSSSGTSNSGSSGGSSSGGSGSGSGSGSGAGGGSGSGSGSGTSGSGGGSATAPATLPILSGTNGPQFSSNPNDLLADQVNLTYQIFNLRMLLERSLTDRLLTEASPSHNGLTRLQAVIEIDVTLDPPKEAKDSAAIVEVTVCPSEKAPRTTKLSLVAMMPQEKTYNSAALSTHDNAFGGSAVAKMITVGYTERHRGQVFYLFRDNDTMAFQRMREDGDDPNNHPEIQFGWQFRPVLGRRSVSPGTRQMFAIIALPDSDEPDQEDSIRLNVHVDAYWKHFDHGTLTTSYHERWVHYVNPAHIPNIPLAIPTLRTKEYADIEVFRSARIQKNLSPVVDKVDWLPTNDKTGTVVVHGKNFFSGTTLTIGGQQYATPADGLVLQSDQTMILHTTVQAVATGDGVINGRYGKSVLLGPEAKATSPPIYIHQTQLKPYGPDDWELLVKLKRNGLPLHLIDAPAPNALFVVFNGTVLSIPPRVTQDQANPDLLDVAVHIPTTALSDGTGVIAVKFAFGGRSWEARLPIYNPLQPIVTRTGGKDKTVLAIAFPRPYSPDFRGTWRIVLDKTYTIANPGDHDSDADVTVKRASPCSDIEPSCHVVILTAKTSLLDTYQKFVIINNAGDFATVSIPPATPSTQPAQINKVNVIAMLQNEARAVTFNGQGLSAIKRVFFNNQDLPFVASGDGKSITVFVSTDVTSKPGHKDIAFQVDLNTILSGGIDVLPSGGTGGNLGGQNGNPQKQNQ